MNQRPTIREQMDACRPDSDDLYLPEHAADLAELQAGLCESAEVRTQWERSQQNGRIIRGAMQDVSLPAGLEGRLFAAVLAAQSAPLAGVEQALREEPPSKNFHASPSLANRRWFMTTAVASLAGMAALVLVGIFGSRFYFHQDEKIDKNLLTTRVEDWLRVADPKGIEWATITDAASFPNGSVLGRVARSGLVLSSQGKIVVYDVSLAGSSSRATLLVIPTASQYPVNAFPASKVQVSGGWSVGAWQKNGVLYVLAVRTGSDTRLEQFIPPQPIG